MLLKDDNCYIQKGCRKIQSKISQNKHCLVDFFNKNKIIRYFRKNEVCGVQYFCILINCLFYFFFQIKPDSTNSTPVPLTPFVPISASAPISKSLDPIVKLFKVDAPIDLDSESRAARAKRRETATESETEPKLNCNNNNNNSSSKRNLSQNSKQNVASKTPPPVLKSLQTLITAAEHMNPKQFELPYELSQPIPFPGTDKSKLIFVFLLLIYMQDVIFVNKIRNLP